jgi:cytochrome c5
MSRDRIIIFSTVGVLLWVSTAFAINEKGKQVYDKACVICHAPAAALAMKSPPAHNEAAWNERKQKAETIAQQSHGEFKTGQALLLHRVKQGYNAMPAGGNCLDPATPDQKCLDEDYNAAIDFMSHKE